MCVVWGKIVLSIFLVCVVWGKMSMVLVCVVWGKILVYGLGVGSKG